MFSIIGFLDLDRGAHIKLPVEPFVVPPPHPFQCREFDLLDVLQAADASWTSHEPAERLSREQTLALIEQEITALPARQREAFLLRYWEELDTAETASVMGCSEGSVKTHCSRAVHALAKALSAKGLKP